jgi:hypothetical protein
MQGTEHYTDRRILRQTPTCGRANGLQKVLVGASLVEYWRYTGRYLRRNSGADFVPGSR